MAHMGRKLQNASHAISTLNEKPLHAALKQWYARPRDRFEAPVDGFLVDIVRGKLLVEIQTRGFAAIRRKLRALVVRHRVRLVYPVAAQKWIVRLTPDGKAELGRRRSPKRGTVEQVFEELVSLPDLPAHPHFSLEVLLIHEEEVRRKDGKRRWRRQGWATQERRFLQVVDRRMFRTPADLCALVPAEMAEPFTTADLADAIDRPRRLAQQMAYCLREMAALEVVGKQGNAILYRRAA